MTLLEVLYRYERYPSEAAMFALGKAREVYGIRRIRLDPDASTIRVEYDATRLNRQTVHQVLRRAGVDLVEELSLIPPQPVAEPPAEPALAQAK
ncbi:MAG: hypothetical protein WAM66_14240 [Acidobacteriaceae bacterium]